jgi:lipid-binding SYLF domain-containing protein
MRPHRRPLTPLSLVLLALLMAVLPALALAAPAPEKRLENATRVLDEIMQSPDRAVPRRLLQDAYAIAIIPDVVKAGLVIGGRRGRGVVSVRSPDGTWSHPAFITLTGGSIGFQAGVQSTDVILVFRTARGVDSIVNGKFTLGADAAVAAGPVGRTAQASTDSDLRAEIYSYSRSRGLFAGVALDGAVLSIDHRANQSSYGRNITPRAVFEGRVNVAPDQAIELRDRLEEYTQR